MMRAEEPFVLIGISAPIYFLLFETYNDFYQVDCEDIPGCQCGHLHFIPAPEMLANSELFEESETKEIIKKAKRIRRSGDADRHGKLANLAIELDELLDDRAAYDTAKMRANFGCRYEDDPPAEFFAKSAKEATPPATPRIAP